MLHSDPLDAIAVGAQFYDLMQREASQARARGLIDTLAPPSLGVLDVGSGTGTPTLMMAQRWNVPVHAVEPSRSMRIGLLTKLAAEPRLAGRVTVHPMPADALTRTRFVDLVTAFWSLQMITPERWDATMVALVEALVPGGRLVAETPPDAAADGGEWHGTATLGEHTIEHTGRIERAEDGSGRGVFAYRWLDASGTVLYEDADEYQYPADRTPRDLTGTLTGLGMQAEEQLADSGPGGSTFTVWRKVAP